MGGETVMLRILIAEDEEPIANLIKMNLRRGEGGRFDGWRAL